MLASFLHVARQTTFRWSALWSVRLPHRPSESRRYLRAETARLRSRRSLSRQAPPLPERSAARARAPVLVGELLATNAHNSSRTVGYSRNLCRAKVALPRADLLRQATQQCHSGK